MHVQVNQRYWLQLMRPIELQSIQHTFNVCLVPQYLPNEDYIQKMGVLERLMYASYKAQEDCIDEPPPLGRWPGIVLRYQWPPNFTPPLPGYLYIHQQVWLCAKSRPTCCLSPAGHLMSCLLHIPGVLQ